MNRFKKLYNGEYDLRFSIVSFPVDGRSAEELYEIAQKRLKRAVNSHPGAVIATG